MTMIGVLGGMGPLATVDFMEKVIGLTRAESDQQHLPMVVANLPQIPDRSRSILGGDEAPLPYLLKGIDLLNRNEVGLIAIPCNSSHHWYAQMSARSAAPVLHIAETCVAAVPAGVSRAAVLATRGALASGFYQRALATRDIEPVVPDDATQHTVDTCIRDIKAGRLAEGSAALPLVMKGLVSYLGKMWRPLKQRVDIELDTHLSYIDQSLEGRDYLVGSAFSAADVQMSFIGELAAIRTDTSRFPNLDAWVRRFQRRPAYQAAIRRGGPYALGSE